MGDNDLDWITADERRLARQQMIGDGSQRIDVRSWVQFAEGRDLLGRHVQGRAAERAGPREVRVLSLLGRLLLDQTEIKQLCDIRDAASLGGKDICRLDISMNKPAGMGLS